MADPCYAHPRRGCHVQVLPGHLIKEEKNEETSPAY